MIRLFFLLLMINLASCNNINYNKSQFAHTNRCISCYEELKVFLKNESNYVILNSIKQNIGNKPYRIKNSNYRLIKLKEFKEYLSNIWLDTCYQKKIALNGDFIGIRFPTKDLLIIEIDYFKRHNGFTQYSDKDLIEYHRLISTKKNNFKEIYSNFLSDDEKIIYENNIGNNWRYLITQTNK